MFNNHTGDNIFHDFELQFKTKLYNDYIHISGFQIHCYTNSQYKQLANVPIIENLEYDTFAYSIDVKFESGQFNTFAAIIYTPELCEQLNFSNKEKCAAIAHEIGHIIHYFNENLANAESMIIEMKADEVVTKLGLGKSLKTVLQKLKLSKLYSSEQSQLLDFRIQYLN